jgi:hypothetical protein
MARARRRQSEIVFRTHGGKRRGAGRKPVGERAGVSHAARGEVSSRAPVLVTLKMKKHVWNLRTKRSLARLLPAFLAVCERFGVRLVHFSVLSSHTQPLDIVGLLDNPISFQPAETPWRTIRDRNAEPLAFPAPWRLPARSGLLPFCFLVAPLGRPDSLRLRSASEARWGRAAPGRVPIKGQ